MLWKTLPTRIYHPSAMRRAESGDERIHHPNPRFTSGSQIVLGHPFAFPSKELSFVSLNMHDFCCNHLILNVNATVWPKEQRWLPFELHSKWIRAKEKEPLMIVRAVSPRSIQWVSIIEYDFVYSIALITPIKDGSILQLPIWIILNYDKRNPCLDHRFTNLQGVWGLFTLIQISMPWYVAILKYPETRW